MKQVAWLELLYFGPLPEKKSKPVIERKLVFNAPKLGQTVENPNLGKAMQEG